MEPAALRPDEIPDGFSAMDPNNLGGGSGVALAGGGGGGNSQQQQESMLKQQQINEQRQVLLDQACTKEALSRLGRIRLVKPEKATAVENFIISMVLQGKINPSVGGQISETKLIEILERGSMQSNPNVATGGGGGGGGSGRTRSTSGPTGISIQRKKYAFDSDDDDDDDEDLL